MSIKKEALWVFTSTGVSAISQLVIYTLLARSGTPEILGELAIINVVLALAFQLQDMGLSSYFIHRQYLTRQECSTLFAINLILGCIAALVVLGAAYPVGLFYNSPNIASGLAIVAINLIFIGATSQYQAHFVKELKNDTLAKIEIGSKIVMLLCAGFFIFHLDLGLFGYLYAVLLGSMTKLTLAIFTAPKTWHPSWSFDSRIIKPALTFGGFQMGSQVINQLRTQADQLIIGKWLGIEVLGIYSLAKELVMQPIKLIAPFTSKLVLPRLARLQGNSVGIASMFERASRAVLAFNMASYAIATISIFYIIPLLFGKDYAQSFDIYAILLLIGLLRPIGSLLGILAQSQGASNVEFRWNILAASIVLATLLLAMPFKSLEAFANAMAFSQLILSSYQAIYFSKYLTGINNLKHLGKVTVITFCYGLFMFTLHLYR